MILILSLDLFISGMNKWQKSIYICILNKKPYYHFFQVNLLGKYSEKLYF